MIIVDNKDVCKICGAYFQNTGYCCNGHLRLTVDAVKKFYKKIDEFEPTKGSMYTVWTNEKYAVVLHENDGEIVSIFDLCFNKFIYFDKKSQKGMEILKDVFVGGSLDGVL